MYPISQVQEPYTAVGYLAARVPLVDLLQLVHPLNRADSDDEAGAIGDQNHPWSAWDVCDGKIKPKLTSASSASSLEQCQWQHSVVLLDGRKNLIAVASEYVKV